MPRLTLWVLANPSADYLKALDRLPEDTHIVAGNSAEAFAAAPPPDAVFIGFGQGKLLEALWEKASRARWMHSFSAGLETTLFPALIDSDIPLTNAKGVFARSLGEWSIAAALFFAKDLRRLVKQQEAGRWEEFDVEELTGKTFGIVGYGGIGREGAVRAKALGMRVVALRRNPNQSNSDPLLDAAYGPSQLGELLSASDYVMVAAPNTPETRGMIGEAELRQMKKSAVLINVGRGPVVTEAALVRALEEGWIRGAALDVFDIEPLPAGHPFYRLENVLLSPHCADHTATWLDEAMQRFLDTFAAFAAGKPLEHMVDKKLGY